MQLALLAREWRRIARDYRRAFDALECEEIYTHAISVRHVASAEVPGSAGREGAGFFKTKTAEPLLQMFIPVVQKHTANLGLAQKYDQIASQGAQLGLIKKQGANIDSYVAQAALDGVYKIIAEEAQVIRANPMKATGALAKKVFGAIR